MMNIFFITMLCFFCNNSLIEKKNYITSNKSNYEKKDFDLKFEKKIIDLGTFKSKDTLLKARYIFTNNGLNSLHIDYVNPDCTCTGYDYTKGEISKGKRGYVDLKYNIKNKIGNQKLYAIVKANTSQKFYRLILKLKVI